MKYPYWIFDMDGTLTDSMPIWSEVPYELVRGFGKTPAPDLGRVLLPMSAFETAQYLIATYDLPLTIDSYTRAAVNAVDRLYRTVSLKPGVEQMLARLECAFVRPPGSLWWSGCSGGWEFWTGSSLSCRPRRATPSMSPGCFTRRWNGWAGRTPPNAWSVRMPSMRPAPPTTPAFR